MSTSEEHKAIVRHAIEAIWRHDTTVFDDHPGFANTRHTVPLVFAAFPDMVLTVKRQIAEGDTVATYGMLRGTHRGAFMGIAPTNKEIQFQYLSFNRVAGGKVVEHNGELGWMSALRQLGVLPLGASS